MPWATVMLVISPVMSRETVRKKSKLRPAITENRRENLAVITGTRRDNWPEIAGDQRGTEDEMPP